MERYEPFASLGLALMTGLLIGLEREQSRPAAEARRGFFGGIRTYPLIALIGAVTTLLSTTLGPWAFTVAGLMLAVLLALSYWRDADAGHTGVTTETSAALTFFLGAFAVADEVVPSFTTRVAVVASVAVMATMLLSLKAQLREFSARLSRDDVIATLKFLLVTVVALPVLPDEPHGPYGALNPFRIGMMVVLIAGVGFVGYVAMRMLGHGRGLLLTGAIGGLVSSTAVTLASSARARQTPALAGLAALAVVLASTIMFLRLVVVLFAAAPSLAVALLWPLGLMGLVGLLGTAALYVRGQQPQGAAASVELHNPFELSSALKFGALFVAILIGSRWAQETFGASGAYVTGLLAGLTNVDAVSLSMANLVKSGATTLPVATRTVVLATLSNTVVKGALCFVLGGAAMGRQVAAIFGVMLAVGLLVLALS